MIRVREKQKITKLELKRQIFHIAFGLIIVFLFYYNLITLLYMFLLLFLGLVLSIISVRYNVLVLSWFLKNFERESDLSKFPGKGMILFFVGCMMVIGFFPKNVALASIMVLTLGDALATIIGKAVGRYTVGGLKTLEGFGMGIIGGFLGAVVFVKPVPAFLGSAIAMLFELLELKIGEIILDDNISVPLLAAFTIEFVIKFGGGLF
ncbi:hypothetical protein HY643_05100 [Candidatus Woesearchaeota archaeon]|nr:hypothetical protein [Candidatus Woesearchaeota archaeon]